MPGESLQGEKVRKGQLWTVSVIATDGTAEGTPALAEIVVANAPPGVPTVKLSPPAPRRGEPIAASMVPAPEPDGDPVQHRFRWSVGGSPTNHPLTTSTLPPGGLKRGDRVSLEVSAFDGLAEGPPAKAEITVANTAPGPPKISIAPAEPRAGQPLRLVIAEPAADLDGDRISYRVEWRRSGKPAATQEALEVPGTEVKKGDRWSVEVVPRDGEANGPSVTHEVQVRNTPPPPPLLALRPERPSTDAAIEVEIVRASEDADGDKVSYAFAWERDGRPVAGPRDRRRLSPGEFKKGERIRVTATPSDSVAEGRTASAETVVSNAPPGAPTVQLDPASPTIERPLRAVVAKAASDADGDPISYRFQWTKNGAPLPYPESQAEVPAAELKKGDLWSATVRAHDGETVGPPSSATVRIGNAAPSPPRVELSPKSPGRGQGLRAVLTEGSDPDGDPLSYRFEWKREGKLVPLPPDSAAVPRDGPLAPAKGELWSVEVYASDGVAESKPARAEVRIANSPPTAPQVACCAQAPGSAAPACGGSFRAGSTIAAEVTSPSADADGDSVTYSYSWTVGGKPQASLAGRRSVPAAEIRKRSTLVVTVTPSDGRASGSAGSAACKMENTPPSAPEISVQPDEPTVETGARVKLVRPAQDPDGDSLAYRYLWLKDGLPLDPGGDGSSVPAGRLRGGETISVTVVAHDGEKEGAPAHVSFRVKNSPPPSPKVTISPAAPVRGEVVACKAEAPATDADGDALRVRLAWLRDGAATPLASDRAELPAGLIAKGETWKCEAWTEDGSAESARASASVAVGNLPPGAPQVSIEPASPTSGVELSCRLSHHAVDPDGDPVRYRYEWWRNGDKVPPGKDPARIEPGRIGRGETWRCAATASDGELEGPPASAEVTVQNGAPGPLRLRLSPRPPKAGSDLTCEIVEPSKDPEGSQVSYRFGWLKDGTPQPFAPSSRTVIGRLVHRAERWSCHAQPSDGELDGPLSKSAELQVQ
ncbi:MAG: hypothetical protein HYZ28_23475 [Myxococcales bacterium]|nr:hypothetical protein [Myxococcales bacterium]